MNFADPFKQLVERKLWPIALLLVAALAAVPFLLASDEPGVLPASTTGVPAGQGATESIVSLADAQKTEDARAVLGVRKDPFRPAQLHPVEKPDDGLTDEGVTTSVGTGGTASSGGGGDVGAGPAPTAEPIATPTEPPTIDVPDPEPTFDLYSLQVRFGDVATGELRTRNVKRLTSLPGGTPAVLYLGLSEDKESAVFLVDAGVDVVGDGKCDPSPSSCETLVMKPGETVFLTRGQRQFELDLIEINTRKTTDQAEARRSRSEVARGGKAALRRMQSATRYRYSESSGTVREVAPAARGLKRARSAEFTSIG